MGKKGDGSRLKEKGRVRGGWRWFGGGWTEGRE